MTTKDTFSNLETRRKRALLTLLAYVICGLTLTAHIALADHHCHYHCHYTPSDGVAPTALSAGNHCTFDHHDVEEHHDAAGDPNASAKYASPMKTPPEPGADRVDPHAGTAFADDTPTLRTGHDPTSPARAPPASLPV